MDEMEQKGIKVSTKEQILIREIRNETEDKAGAAQGYGLYDVNADYTPVFDADYLAECREFYNRYFPDSGIAIRKLAGSAGKLAGTLLKMKDRILNGAKAGITDPGEILRKLDALIDAHKYDEYETGTEKSVCSASSRGFMSRRTMKALYLKIYGWVL